MIIGAKGMLGQYLVDIFRDCDVFTFDREELDITDKQNLEKKIKEIKPEILINAAAYNNVDQAEKEFELANLINGKAVGFLAKMCRENGILFIHYSTDYVFGGEKEEGYDEEDETGPVNKYGQSKLLGEKLLLDQAFEDFKYYLIRTSRLFGRKGEGENTKKNFVDKMLELAGENKELKVIDEEFSNPTYALDLAKKTREIIALELPFGIYHVANSGACTWYEFAKKIFDLSGIEVELTPVLSKEFPRPAQRPLYSKLNNNKLSEMRPWQEALDEYLKSL